MKTLAIMLALAGLPVAALAEVGDLVQFVSCPVYRDTDFGRKSGCWLTTDPTSGRRWDVSHSPYKPNWDYAILVEGRISDEGVDACGAPVLEPVRTSRLLTMRCRQHMLPAEGYPGREFFAPVRYISPLSRKVKTPEGPFGPRTFYVFFEFDRDFMVYQYSDYLIEQAVNWLREAKPTKLIVTGYAATDPITVSGVELAEHPETARTRAELTSETLKRLMPGMEIETRWETGSQPIDTPDADTIPGQSQRRVEIQAVF